MAIRVTIENTGFSDEDFKNVVSTMRDDMHGAYVSENQFDINTNQFQRLQRYRRERNITFTFEYV